MYEIRVQNTLLHTLNTRPKEPSPSSSMSSILFSLLCMLSLVFKVRFWSKGGEMEAVDTICRRTLSMRLASAGPEASLSEARFPTSLTQLCQGGGRRGWS